MTEGQTTDRRFKIEDASSYADVVDEYDRFVRRFSAPLVDRLLSMAEVGGSTRVLDVGTGSGIVALGAAELLDERGRVEGVDLSGEMLATARSHAEAQGHGGKTRFVRMDAESLAFADGLFDTVVSLFALLHLPDPLTGLREMLRVLRPGGLLVVAAGSRAPLLEPRVWPHLAGRALDVLKVIAGRRLEAPGFLDSLVEKHCAPRDEPEESALASAGRNRTRRIPSLVREAGFQDVSTHWEGHERYLETAEDFWDMQRTYSSFARKRLEDPVGREAVHEEFLRRARAVQDRGGRLAYPYGAIFVRGRRPR